jgi:2-polyprenyl-6-methoxyphenol hydroxylase-like FAD-dependent oxidoreductase
MKARDVLISGSGIAGPTLAYWLNQHASHVTIVERAPALRGGGAAVDFRGRQVDLLRRMGVLAEVRSNETAMGEIALVDGAGRHKAALPAEFLSGEVEILRGDLARILYEVTQDSTEYVFGDWITSITDTDKGAQVTFAHGEPRTFDLVVGADGVHSGVRRLVFGSEVKPRHLGYYIAGITAPNHLGLQRTGVLYNEPGRGVLVTNPAEPDAVWAGFAFSSGPLDYDRHNTGLLKNIVAEHCAGMGWETPKLLEALPDASDFFFSPLGLIELDRWSSGRTVLLGDAAWSSGIGGLGTGMAMLGAYVLAGEISTASDHTTAFACYERQMRPSVRMGHGQADRIGPFLAPGKILPRDLLVKVMYSRLLAGVFNWASARSAERLQLKDYGL